MSQHIAVKISRLKEFVRFKFSWLADFLVRAIDPLGRISYSQEGEDLLLRRIFEGKKTGFYVDVGAHHPKRFSNTHIFYKSGWRGINIEPNPAALMSFTRERKGDINLQFGVASERGDLLYYEFDDPALNTFDKKLAEERESTTSYRLIATQRVRIDRLDALLEAHVPQGVTIDFLTVDVEGMDLDVLKSNNWNKFRPRCVLTEILDTPLTIESLAGSPTIVYLQQQGYRLLAKTYNSFFFLDDRVDQIGRTDI